MSPRKEFPDYEPDILIGRRELQRARRVQVRRQQGRREPSALAGELRRELWLYRELNELTQHQLGELLGMKQPQIARLESGFVDPSIETLARISERLGIDFTIELRSGTLRVSSTRPENRQA